MKKVSAWAAAHAPAGTRWGRRALSLLLSLVLCLTLLPGAAFAADTDGHWAEKTITDWQQKGYISGYSDGTFRPDSSITRAEFIKILNRVLGLTAEGSISFSDVKESDWFYAEVAKAVAAGYAQGSADGTFRPNAPITRAEAAAMLARAFQLTENEARAEKFADASAIPAWAKGSVGAVAEAGYMTGYPDGSFGASGSITRAEAVVTADRAEHAAAEDTKKPTTPGSGSGGTVTPPSSPDQPDQPTTPAIEVAAIGTVADIEVATGTLTDADAAIAALPKQVVMMDSAGSSIKDNGANVLADVEWKSIGYEIKNSTNLTAITTGFKGTLSNNETECVNTFSGKVTMPSGYTFTGNASALTITITITVKKADDETLTTKTINSAVIADISQDLESYVSENKVLDELKSKNLLPTTLDLYYGDQFVATVDIPDNTAWTATRDTSGSENGKYKYTLTPTIKWDKIKLPAGYQADSSLKPNCSVYVKALNTDELQAAIDAATKLKNSISEVAANELAQATDSSITYIVPSGTTADKITKNVKFVVDDGRYSAFCQKLTDANSKNGNAPASFNYQTECDTLADELEKATTALKTLLAKPTMGTVENDAYILQLVKKELENAETGDAYAFSSDNRPLKEAKNYKLPTTLTVTTESSATHTVSLSWTCANTSNITISGGNVTVTTAPATPQAVTFTAEVTLGEQKIGDISFDATLGAPIARYPNTSGDDYVAIDKLTSGKEQTFWIRIPLQDNHQKIETVTVAQTSAECNLLTGPITVIEVDSDVKDQRGLFSVVNAQLTATAKQLPAVVASDSSADYTTATVTLSIPYDAVTLTDAAKAAGWYIPKDGLTLQGEVNIWHPLVKIEQPTLDGNDVYIVFNTKHWSSSYTPTVYMALVPMSGTTVADSAPQGNRVVTGGDATYDLTIPVSGLTAGTYNVWVKIGDGNWLKSNTTYTHTTGN